MGKSGKERQRMASSEWQVVFGGQCSRTAEKFWRLTTALRTNLGFALSDTE
jgi:hypothetical protein